VTDVNLLHAEQYLEYLVEEGRMRGLPNSIVDRFVAAKDALPIIEKARQAQDRRNG